MASTRPRFSFWAFLRLIRIGSKFVKLFLIKKVSVAPTSRSGVPTLAHPAETRDSVPPVGLARTDATVAVAHYRWGTVSEDQHAKKRGVFWP
jgi:hypothetical protein